MEEDKKQRVKCGVGGFVSWNKQIPKSNHLEQKGREMMIAKEGRRLFV